MVIKFFKIISYCLLSVFVLAIVCVSLILFRPTILLALANNFTDYQIEASTIELQLSPLEIQTSGLTVRQNSQTMVDLAVAEFAFDWSGSLQGKHTVWQGRFANGYIDFTKLASTKPATEQSVGNRSATITRQVHAGLTAVRGNVENVRFIFSDTSSLSIQSLSTNLKGDELEGYRTLEQIVSLRLRLDENSKPLILSGQLSSSSVSDLTYLSLVLQEVDLTPYLSGGPIEEPIAPVGIESELDWSWLSLVEDLQVVAKVEKITLDDNEITSAHARLKFVDGINIESVTAKVDWAISDELRFNDDLSLSGTLAPLATQTKGADVRAKLNVDALKFDLELEGQVNVNNFAEQNIGLQLNLSEPPVLSQSGELMDGLLQQYLPVSFRSQLSSSADELELSIEQAKFGESTMAGELSVEGLNGELPKVRLGLVADKIAYKSLSAEASANTNKEPEDNSKTKIFTDKPIDWAWLELADLDFEINIKTLMYEQYSVSDIVLPLTLTGNQDSTLGRILAIEDFRAHLGDGNLNATIGLVKGSEPAQITLDLDATGLLLESLGVLPADQLTGGDFAVDTKLTLVGDSLDALASSSDGALYVELKNAVVQSDSFEIIGSDLLLELLSKLNPFSREDKTTNLECAILFAPIDKGKIELKDSLALKTSKVIIVGAGDINLASEKINLKLSPTSRGGVGVNVGSLVKFVKLGGQLNNPKPIVDAGGLMTSTLAAGAAISTGGASLLATGLLDKAVKQKVCEKAREAYQQQSSN